MKAVELEKNYDPKSFEDKLYESWEKTGQFLPRYKEGVKPFVIVIPPPNVTGVLHMGHGLNNSLQDILIRYYRMKGIPTLWIPGTDHAGIATQNVVEKRLMKEGKTKHDLGREKFIERTWEVKKEHHAIITKQLKKIGASVDWTRERFTMDEGLSQAVREVFVTLYERGLIYKGQYLVNWCPRCGTALADDEVDHIDTDGAMYHIWYEFADGPAPDGSTRIEIATTRPETLLGDTAVAVHPDDERYKAIVGKKLKLPLTDRVIPIIADTYVDKEFGTGMVKITPAHDPNDWEVGKRHNLEVINILNPDGTLNNNCPEKYRGMTCAAARELVNQDLKDQGLFKGEEKLVHSVGHCYRCKTVVEPFLSYQWFVKMRPLAEKALNAWKKGEIVFHPQKWENTYTHWLENIRDWCISRQLWWGHRIPVWYCDKCGEMIVARKDPAKCPKCGHDHLRQDEDVLDTWFSSWLWPFSTLGWPEKTDDLKKYYPTSTLVTAYDIIFFWVSRMIMAGLEFTGEVPFKDIYIHGLVRDKLGRKMSKSLGNGIDPLDIVAEYGADAFKFTLAFLAAQGQDILIDSETFKFGSKFANKIWNASRYILMNLEGRNLIPLKDIALKDVDKWILHRLNETVAEVDKAIKGYRFNDAAKAMYEFFWNDFCDWYVESSKLSLYSGDDAEKDRAVSLIIHILDESLRLLHPFLSFITEEIYQKLPEHEASIVNAPYPEYTADRENPDIAAKFASLQTIVSAVRTMRSELTVPPSKKVRVMLKLENADPFFKANSSLMALLMSASSVELVDQKPAESGCVMVAGTGFEAYVSVKDVIDVPQEIAKLKAEIAKNEKILEKSLKKLENPQFMSKAAPEAIAKEQAAKEELTTLIEKKKTYLAELS
ncbi:MAG: valine--tRNA ligase [Spirochaetales bacterium]|nr:valine--tRNA ligase [Spirochaetales bacterium]